MKTKWVLTCLAIIVAVLVAVNPARAVITTNLYASFTSGNSLDVGTPAAPTVDANGTPTTVAGFTGLGDNTGNAVNFGASGSLPYGASSGYANGFTPGGTVEENTFRLIYKPDFSGNPTGFRAILLGLGYLGGYNGIYLRTDEDNGGRPSFLASINNVGENNTAAAGFSWDSSTWYYIAASMDASGSTLYVRALTSGSTALVTTDTFAGSTWGSGGLDNGTTAFPLRIGGRSTFGSASVVNESARGTIDEVLILGGTRWDVASFDADFQTFAIPEPATVSLLFIGVGLVAARRKR